MSSSVHIDDSREVLQGRLGRRFRRKTRLEFCTWLSDATEKKSPVYSAPILGLVSATGTRGTFAFPGRIIFPRLVASPIFAILRARPRDNASKKIPSISSSGLSSSRVQVYCQSWTGVNSRQGPKCWIFLNTIVWGWNSKLHRRDAFVRLEVQMDRATLTMADQITRLAMGNYTCDTVSTATHRQSGYIAEAIGEREIST
ncbi:hypothetical protein BKA61DRAFT_574224 [Leptodontidium sp. MPI-SDFR-AT-0119]|nr:hypothetical protein BKA61DRAFT_574224 [Leptodontidium sp. MPI-SDFR-AT-0119]